MTSPVLAVVQPFCSWFAVGGCTPLFVVQRSGTKEWNKGVEQGTTNRQQRRGTANNEQGLQVMVEARVTLTYSVYRCSIKLNHEQRFTLTLTPFGLPAQAKGQGKGWEPQFGCQPGDSGLFYATELCFFSKLETQSINCKKASGSQMDSCANTLRFSLIEEFFK